LTAGLASIDIVQSTELANRLGDQAAAQLFDKFHTLVDTVIAEHNGRLYARTGDGSTVLFPNVASALYASIDILEEIGGLVPADDDVALYIRIGLIATDESKLRVPPEQRNRGESGDLFRVAELQKNCPVGRIAISRSVYDHLGARQALFRPASAAVLRRLDAFVYTGRQRVAYTHLLDGLTKAKAEAVPPIQTIKWRRLTAVDYSLNSLRAFFDDPLVIVPGETSRRLDSNHGSAATSDAAKLLEIMSRLPANPKVTAAIDVWEEAADLAGQRNILIVGSGLVNAFAFAINDLIEIAHFEKHSGAIYSEIVVRNGRERLKFGSRALIGRYCGLVVHCASPFNLHRRLLWVAGTTGRGTQAAMRLVEDLIFEPRETMAVNGLPTNHAFLGAIVTAQSELGSEVDVPSNHGVSKYRLVGVIDSADEYVPVSGRTDSWSRP
jgi:hypothetical protein